MLLLFRDNAPRSITMKYKLIEDRTYTLKSVPIGYDPLDGSEITLSLPNSRRILLIGSTGSGKTTFLSGLLDRFMLGGGSGFVVDYKGEYNRKYLPLQDHLKKFLLPNEQPKGLAIKSYYPYFLQMITKAKLEHDEELIQFSFEDMTAEDFFTIMGIDDSKQKDLVYKIWYKIMQEGAFSIGEIEKILEEDSELHPSSKKRFIGQLKVAMDRGLIGSSFPIPEFHNRLNDSEIVNLNLHGMSAFASTNNPATAYAAVFLRKLYNYKTRNIITKSIHLGVVIDELNKFCPHIGEPPSKAEILKLMDLSRHTKISMFMGTQDIRRIPPTILGQSEYVFISPMMRLDDVAEIFKMVLPAEYDNPQTFKSKIASILSTAMKSRRSKREKVWLFLNKISGEYFIVKPAVPVSYLKQEGE